MFSPDEKQITNYEGIKYPAFVFLFLCLVVLDQVSKFFAKNVFYNSVFAFSLPLPVWLIYVVYTIVLGIMLVYCQKNFQKFSKQQSLAWVVIFSGAASNVSERIILGYVRDWIYIGNGVFNLADLCIIAGILILLLNPKSEYQNTKNI
jgi:lipoprotein signal peptidase